MLWACLAIRAHAGSKSGKYRKSGLFCPIVVSSFVAPDCPPSALHPSSWLVRWKPCPSRVPIFPSSLPSRLSTASSTPWRLSVPRNAVAPLMERSVPSWKGAPFATWMQPNWSWLHAWEDALPPEFVPFFEQAAPAIARTLTSATAVKNFDLVIPPPSERRPNAGGARVGIELTARGGRHDRVKPTNSPRFRPGRPPFFRFASGLDITFPGHEPCRGPGPRPSRPFYEAGRRGRLGSSKKCLPRGGSLILGLPPAGMAKRYTRDAQTVVGSGP